MSNDTQEQTVSEGREEYKILTSPNFTSLMYDLEKHLHGGWEIHKEIYPDFNFFLYDLHLVRNAVTIAKTKERLEGAIEGRPTWTTEQKRDNMAKARETRMKKIAEKRAGEGVE